MSQYEKEVKLHQIFQKIFVLLDDGDRRALKQANLTGSQYNLLRILHNNSDPGLTITDIANQLLCTRGNATRMVRRLEKQALVQVTGDANDQRLVRVRLSSEGEQRFNIAHATHLASLKSRFDSLTPERQQQLYALLTEVGEQLEVTLNDTST